MKKIKLVYVSSLFLFLFALGVLAISGEKSFSEEENRSLTNFSLEKLADKDYKEVEALFQDALSDQWKGRTRLVHLSSTIRNSLGITKINGTYIGKDGHLFNVVTERDFDNERYKRNLSYVEELFQKGEAKGTKNTLLLVPSPGTILKDKLPDSAVLYDADSKYREAGDIVGDSLLDVRNEFNAVKEDNLYYKTDHHYSSIGAHICRDAYRKEHSEYKGHKVSDEFLGTLYSRVLINPNEKDTIEAYDNEEAVTCYSGDADNGGKPIKMYDKDKLATKDKYAYFFGGNEGLITIKGKGDKNLLVIKDSFANSMIPMLAEEYNNIYMVDLRYYSASVDILLEKDIDEILVMYEMTNFMEEQTLFKITK